MNRKWRWLLPCYLFTLPMTLVGLLLGKTFYGASAWRWYDGVLGAVAGSRNGITQIWGRPNAQTLGWVVFYDTEEHRAETDLRVHEYTHVVQAFAGSLAGVVFCPLLCMVMGWSPWWGLALGGFVGGLGFAILYVLLFLYLLLKQGGGWYDAYRANPFEVQAYETQDQYLRDELTRPWGT